MPLDAIHQGSFSGKSIYGASRFASGTLWLSAEISGVWAYTPELGRCCREPSIQCKRGRRITLLCAGGLVPDVVVTAEDGTAWQSALRSVTGGRCQKLVRVIVRAAGAWFRS